MFEQIIGDVFEHTQDRTPVHCIASDHCMGAGIAVPMARLYNLREEMDRIGTLPYPDCLYINGVLNMVTKKSSADKPSFEDFCTSLKCLGKLCREKGIKRLVMPRIGCGLDALSWSDVKECIKKELSDLDVLVCVKANRALTIERLEMLEEFRGSLIKGLEILKKKIAPVVILGQEFKDSTKPVEATLLFVNSIIEGQGIDEKQQEILQRLYALMDK